MLKTLKSKVVSLMVNDSVGINSNPFDQGNAFLCNIEMYTLMVQIGFLEKTIRR